jgi:hypothetical protein
LLAVQQDLVVLMGELATLGEDLPCYVKGGYKLVQPEMTVKLDDLVRRITASRTRCGCWRGGLKRRSAADRVVNSCSRLTSQQDPGSAGGR